MPVQSGERCVCKSVTVMASLFSSHRSQASQLGVYKAFVDNYKEAVETAEKCSHANIQFQEISEVSPRSLPPGLLHPFGRT